MIIGLTGYAQSGKDTVAKFLCDKYGYTRVAFADPIRDLLYEMDPPVPVGVGSESHIVGLQNYVDVYGWDDAKQHPTVRSMLQNLGVGARKVFSEKFWVDQAMKKMLEAPKTDLKYVITDVRFKNEADMLKANGGQIWRVTRLGVNAVNNHISESEMNDYPADQTFINDGTIEDLYIAIKTRMNAI